MKEFKHLGVFHLTYRVFGKSMNRLPNILYYNCSIFIFKKQVFYSTKKMILIGNLIKFNNSVGFTPYNMLYIS